MYTIDNITLTETKSVRKIREYLMNPKAPKLKNKDWQNLRQEVERYYPTFHEEMFRGEHLKDKEYYLCLLVKADFMAKEIEYLLGYREKSLSTLKRRLLFKISGIKGSAKDFNRFLLAIQ